MNDRPDSWEDWVEEHGVTLDDVDIGQSFDFLLDDDPTSVKAASPAPIPVTPPKKSPKKQSKQARYEQKFDEWWSIYGDPQYEMKSHQTFYPGRKWEIDRAFLPEKVAVEIEGMSGSGNHPGGHRGPTGFLKDIEKYNAMTETGWALFRCATWTLYDDEKMKHLCQQIVDKLRERAK